MPDTRITIYYCNGCRWLPRASWMAQELLTTFAEELDEVALRPGASGQFDILLNEKTLWCRKQDGGFPELKEIKQRIRDHIAPDKSLGHSDTDTDTNPNINSSSVPGCGPVDCDSGKATAQSAAKDRSKPPHTQ